MMTPIRVFWVWGWIVDNFVVLYDLSKSTAAIKETIKEFYDRIEDILKVTKILSSISYLLRLRHFLNTSILNDLLKWIIRMHITSEWLSQRDFCKRRIRLYWSKILHLTDNEYSFSHSWFLFLLESLSWLVSYHLISTHTHESYFYIFILFETFARHDM